MNKRQLKKLNKKKISASPQITITSGNSPEIAPPKPPKYRRPEQPKHRRGPGRRGRIKSESNAEQRSRQRAIRERQRELKKAKPTKPVPDEQIDKQNGSEKYIEAFKTIADNFVHEEIADYFLHLVDLLVSAKGIEGAAKILKENQDYIIPQLDDVYSYDQRGMISNAQHRLGYLFDILKAEGVDAPPIPKTVYNEDGAEFDLE